MMISDLDKSIRFKARTLIEQDLVDRKSIDLSRIEQEVAEVFFPDQGMPPRVKYLVGEVYQEIEDEGWCDLF